MLSELISLFGNLSHPFQVMNPPQKKNKKIKNKKIAEL